LLPTGLECGGNVVEVVGNRCRRYCWTRVIKVSKLEEGIGLESGRTSIMVDEVQGHLLDGVARGTGTRCGIKGIVTGLHIGVYC
jgi:hypothetical protein